VERKERRHSIRVESRTEIQYRADDTRAEGFIEDLSEAGAWVDTLQPLPVGTEVVFQFSLPDEQQEIPLTGNATVVRTEPTVGMALEFRDLQPETVARIRFHVGALYFGQDPSDLP
jgi:uncharacterized protein (TIGR02266 family)